MLFYNFHASAYLNSTEIFSYQPMFQTFKQIKVIDTAKSKFLGSSIIQVLVTLQGMWVFQAIIDGIWGCSERLLLILKHSQMSRR